ncbi:MAG: hypothetical protein JWO60_3386 [Frankiales bacterium]|nr:hypothetical protein [Frankiales bacterium]
MSDTPSRRRPSAQVVLSVVGALVGLAFAIGLYRSVGPDTSAATQSRGFVVDSDTQVTVEFELARAPGRAATCLVRARGADGTEVGQRQFDIPASTRRSIVVKEALPTTARANTGEVVGCRLGSSEDREQTPAP